MISSSHRFFCFLKKSTDIWRIKKLHECREEKNYFGVLLLSNKKVNSLKMSNSITKIGRETLQRIFKPQRNTKDWHERSLEFASTTVSLTNNLEIFQNREIHYYKTRNSYRWDKNIIVSISVWGIELGRVDFPDYVIETSTKEVSEEISALPRIKETFYHPSHLITLVSSFKENIPVDLKRGHVTVYELTNSQVGAIMSRLIK